MKRFTQKHADLKRLRHVTQVLIKHGFGYLVQQVFAHDHFFARQLRRWKLVTRVLNPPDPSISLGERLRTVMEELGPTYIKLGQILSTRPDLIPIEICEELGKLQDSVPSIPYEKIVPQFKQAFGKKPEELFTVFHHEPIGAASLAQVHTAVLPDGTEVIVKVQRPGIEEVIGSDIGLLRQIADLTNRHMPGLRAYDLPGVVEQFAKTVAREIDFDVEARSIDTFRKNFKNHPHVYIPRVFHEFSAERILTLEQLHGQKLRTFISTETSVQRKKRIARYGARAVLQQVFIHGFFHADPHPGNVFVLKDDTIGFVDFGMIGRLNPQLRSIVGDMLVGLVDHDIDRLIETYRKLNMINDSIDIHKFKSDMEEFIDQYYEIPVSQIRMDKVLMNALILIRTYDIRVPRELYLMIKTMIIAEGIAHQLDPQFDMIAQTKPFAARMIRQRYHPSAIMNYTKKMTHELFELISIAPKELKQILYMVRKGELKLEFEHYGLENLIHELDRSSNRIAFSLVIASLIVGSSLIMLTRTGPLYLGMPVLGLVGYILAAVMGFGLAWAILRSGKL
ncbi:MAG: AarF/ABC1/UbiB kinase family protein [Candidatus Auribacterota bacterium]